MIKGRPLALALLWPALLCMIPVDAEAVCACGISVQCAAVGGSAAVFAGRVTAHVRRGPGEWVATINVEQTFKGSVAAVVEVPVNGECDADLRPGRQYLVYAEERDGRLVATACSRTRLIREAKPDLAFIRGLTRAGRNGTLYGAIAFPGTDEEPGRREPLVRVIAQGRSKRHVLYRGAGSREFELSLTPGRYDIVLEGPVTLGSVLVVDGAQTLGTLEPIVITPGACVYVVLDLKLLR